MKSLIAQESLPYVLLHFQSTLTRCSERQSPGDPAPRGSAPPGVSGLTARDVRARQEPLPGRGVRSPASHRARFPRETPGFKPVAVAWRRALMAVGEVPQRSAVHGLCAEVC